MFARLKHTGPDVTALQRVEAAVRAHFGLGEGDLVVVSEEAGRLPGEPEKITTVIFWRGEQRHRVRVFKPVSVVVLADLPAAWAISALRDEGEADCC